MFIQSTTTAPLHDDHCGSSQSHAAEIEATLELLDSLPPARDGQPRIDPAPLIVDPVREAVTDVCFPRYFWPQALKKASAADRKAQDKMWLRVKQHYSNRARVAREVAAGHATPADKLRVLKAATCRVPGMKLGADPRCRKLGDLATCKQPFLCPCCLWRHLVGAAENPGPAYEIGWALHQGSSLNPTTLWPPRSRRC